MSALTDRLIDDVYLTNVLIQMNDPEDHETIDKIEKALELTDYGGQKVYVAYKTAGLTAKI